MQVVKEKTGPEIEIPMINGVDVVKFYPDELPVDYNDVIDVLRSELAPFGVWRACAIEYRRQGMDQAFDSILNEIVVALEDTNVDKIFRERVEYAEGLTEIYVALAANAMYELTRNQRSAETDPQQVEKVVAYLKSADDKLRMNEYTWLVKGFFELLIYRDTKRAEDNFKAVHDRATKGQNQLKKKFLFGSLLGLGMVAFARQKYQVALDHFSKAILANPSCSGTVRMAVVCCCFKLEQYERAKLAVDNALKLEPTNANVLVAKALLEVVTSAKQQKEKGANAKRAEQVRQLYLDCLQMALVLDGTNAQALNLLANHYFQSHSTLEFVDYSCLLMEGGQYLVLPKSAVNRPHDESHPSHDKKHKHKRAVGEDMRVGDRLTLHHKTGGISSSWFIAELVQDAARVQSRVALVSQRLSGRDASEFAVVRLTAVPGDKKVLLKEDGVVTIDSLQLTKLSKVVEFASRAKDSTHLSAVKAEAHYILGKVQHSRGQLSEAFECYWQALKESPELSLAAFGAAQILFSERKLDKAQELFEKVLAKNPDDKDTQAYVMLLKAMNKGLPTPFEKLREIAPGFKFEIDLWLLQGHLRQKVFAEYPTALKCYQHAMEGIEQTYGADKIPPVLFSNVAVLQHALGKPEKALESCKRALVTFSKHQIKNGANGAEAEWGVIHNNAEFEGVFYQWSEQPLCHVQLNAESDVFEVVNAEGVDLSLHLNAGDEVVLGDVKHTVRTVSARSFTAYSPVKLASLANANTTGTYPLLTKKIFPNFTEATVTFCYNYARVLEDVGRTKAASELYVELLKRHPSFMECYLRQSLISSDAGKTNEATTWLTRAQEVSSDQPDVTICLGDLYLKSEKAVDARRCYDKIVATSRHDARSMLSLGNYCYNGGSKAESRLKDSYKYFYHVLNEDATNIYAANGLAMVCAEKGELDAAKDIFAKAREANKSEDIGVNLANVFMHQNRILDAERLYQTSYNNLLRSSHEAVSTRAATLTECVSFAQFRQNRYDDAIKSLQRAIHLHPDDMKLWYNLAIVSKQSAAAVARKQQKTSVEIEDAKHDLLQAVTILDYAHRSIKNSGRLSKYLKPEAVQAHLLYCKEKFSLLESQLERTLVEEAKRREERQKQQIEHESRLRMKLEEKEQQERAAEAEKREKQLLAAQKQAKLAELQEKWVVATEASQKSKREPGAGGAGKRKRKDKTEEDEILAGLDSDEDDGGDIRPIMQQKQTKSSKSSQQPAAPKKVVYAAAPEGEVDFGSSSDEDDAVPRAGKTQLDIDLFGDDSDDDGAAAAKARKRKTDEAAGGDEGGVKRKRLSKQVSGGAGDGSDSDDFTEEATGSSEAAVSTASASGKRLTIDSDEE